ncbi:hypothetical protein [Streptomyces sp. NPDC002215]|uniref:competence protein CoiA family protein n=1 Tax=Streptomyces sp. NPDC002215 TaxID=3154412 RepID=UPI0033337B44
MPLSAIHAEHGTLDLTLDGLGCEGRITWEQIHRARPRAPLTCPECEWGLCPKYSQTSLRYFAHDPDAPECSLREETEQHRQLKRDLAECCRRVPGWSAELEQAGPERAWRADVLATHTATGRRYAFEAQLSTIGIDGPRGLTERTARMTEAGVPAAWVTTGSRAWLGAVPTIQAEAQTGPTRPVRAGHWTYLISSWTPAAESRTPARLTDFVRAVLTGELVAHRVTCPARDDWSTRPGWSWVWATPKDIAEAAAYV